MFATALTYMIVSTQTLPVHPPFLYDIHVIPERYHPIQIIFKTRRGTRCVLSFYMDWRILVSYPMPEAMDKIY